MAVPDKVTKKLDLDLSKVPRGRRAQVKEEIGEFVVGEILDQVAQGRSPVAGKGRFKQLNPNYADKEKGGDRNPNLDLEGDMLNSVTSKNTADGIEVGVFKQSEVPKAFNHNTGDTLPQRQFIPEEKEGFKRDIQSGIDRIINQNSTRTTIPTRTERARSFAVNLVSSFTIDDLFEDDGI